MQGKHLAQPPILGGFCGSGYGYVLDFDKIFLITGDYNELIQCSSVRSIQSLYHYRQPTSTIKMEEKPTSNESPHRLIPVASPLSSIPSLKIDGEQLINQQSDPIHNSSRMVLLEQEQTNQQPQQINIEERQSGDSVGIEIQIWDKLDKMQIMETVQKLIADVGSLQNRVQQLETENQQLRAEIVDIRKEEGEWRDKMETRHIKDIKKVKDQLDMYQTYNEQLIANIGNKCEVQQSKIMSLSDYMQVMSEPKIKHRFSEPRLPLLDVERQMRERNMRDASISHLSIQSNQPNPLYPGPPNIQDLKLPPVTLQAVPISPTSSSSSYFTVSITQQLTRIGYTGSTGTWTHILSSTPIPSSKIVQYVFRIEYSSSNAISVGILDRRYQTLRCCGKREANCIFYYGGSGRLWEAGRKLQKEGKGFVQGDTLVMVVGLGLGTVLWYVNGFLEAHYCKAAMFNGKNKSVDWVPFINMSTKNDTITWQVGEHQ